MDSGQAAMRSGNNAILIGSVESKNNNCLEIDTMRINQALFKLLQFYFPLQRRGYWYGKRILPGPFVCISAHVYINMMVYVCFNA